MPPITPFSLLLLLSTTVAAQASQVTWAAVTFTYHGEKIPALGTSPYYLTPQGAQEMFNSGGIVRARYIDPPFSNGSLTGSAPINGLSTFAINNDQLYVMSTDEVYTAQSAMAFMQGLYPQRTGVTFDQQGIQADGSLTQYPLDGYQYPSISTVSVLDFNSIYIAGSAQCSAYNTKASQAQLSPAFIKQVQTTNDFYHSLSSSVFSNLPIEKINYRKATDLYEYALFQHNHNTTLYNSTDFPDSALAQLETLASAQGWTFNTPSGGDNIQAMAGRTLASKVLQLFNHNIDSFGTSNKLSVLLGSYETFLAFFALSNLSTGPSASKFNSLPQHGSTMTFELYSITTTPTTGNLSSPFPDISDLRLRFLYRNGTSDSESLIEYALFGRGNSEADMSWADFETAMEGFALGTRVDWCRECSASLLFCASLEVGQMSNSSSSNSGSSSGGSSGISPVVAGVVGAAATIAASMILAAALLLFGFRFEQRGERSRSANAGGDLGVLKRSGSGNGGFKGAEKLASDMDLPRGAGATIVRHERVGSWELNDNARGGNHFSLDKEIESGRHISSADYGRRSEDGFGRVDPFGDPVRPLDQL